MCDECGRITHGVVDVVGRADDWLSWTDELRIAYINLLTEACRGRTERVLSRKALCERLPVGDFHRAEVGRVCVSACGCGSDGGAVGDARVFRGGVCLSPPVCGKVTTTVSSVETADSSSLCDAAGELLDAGDAKLPDRFRDVEGRSTGGEEIVDTSSESETKAETVNRGRHFLKNSRKRERAKALRRGVGVGPRVDDSLKEKWRAENELAVLRARQNIAILERRDLDAAANLQRTRVAKNLERNMVEMEKSHSYLRSTGNVPGEVGFAATVVDSEGSGPSLSISPNSSISEAEARRAQKELLDEREKNAKLLAVFEDIRYNPEYHHLYSKELWTDNAENDEKLHVMYDDYIKRPAGGGKVEVIPLN